MQKRNRQGLLVGLGVVLLAAGVIGGSWLTIPERNMDATHVDVLVVLGTPANEDGTASPEERERVLEGVREFRAGRAGHMILTGGSAHNRFVEGAVMAALAVKEGVPVEDVVVEGKARNTIENVFYSHAIMQAHGWRSAEIVSSPSHLPRTGLILGRYKGAEGFAWRTDAARWPVEYSWWKIGGMCLYEAAGTTKLRWFGFRRSAFLPE